MAAKKKLGATTILPGAPGSGEAFTVLGPDDDVPEWALAHLGDHLFEGSEYLTGVAAAADGEVDTDDADDRTAGAAPKRSGKS